MFVIFQFLYFSTKIKKHVNFQVGTMVHCKLANRTIMCKFLIQNKVTLSTIMYLEAHVRSKHCTYEKPHGEIQQMFPQQSVSTNRGSQLKTCFFLDTRNVFPQGNSFSVALPLLNVYLWAAWHGLTLLLESLGHPMCCQWRGVGRCRKIENIVAGVQLSSSL